MYDTFNINGVTWYIFRVNSNSARLLRSDGTYTVGVCDSNDNAIYISDAIGYRFLDKVIIHEVCHAYCFSYGIVMDIKTEEMLCDFVATYGREIFKTVDELFYIINNVA